MNDLQLVKLLTKLNCGEALLQELGRSSSQENKRAELDFKFYPSRV